MPLHPPPDARCGARTSPLFLAHVPAAVLADSDSRRCSGDSGTDGWMAEGELWLFGIDALRVFPHPQGDVKLVIETCT